MAKWDFVEQRQQEIQVEGVMSLWDMEPVNKEEREQGEGRTSQCS